MAAMDIPAGGELPVVSVHSLLASPVWDAVSDAWRHFLINHYDMFDAIRRAEYLVTSDE
jgi:hypothetical protein